MRTLIIIFLSCGLTINAFSQTTSSSKSEKIHQLLELTGSGKLGVQVAKNMISTFRSSYSNVEQEFWDEFEKEIKAEDLVNLIIPIYDKHFTEEEIDQLIDFYNTPIGKKSIEVLPMITQESLIAGQKWGQQLGEKVVQRLRDKGYIQN